MIFCEKCFSDKVISDIIKFLPKTVSGDCSICNHKDVHLYDTETMNDLTPYFEGLLSIYSSAKKLDNNNLIDIEKITLVDDLKRRWKIFDNDLSKGAILEILKNIVPELYKNEPSLFEDNVIIPELYDSEYLEEHSLLKNKQWQDFVNEIKTKNRFHSKLINFEILRKYCTFIRKSYKKGKLFYRARNSSKNGYPCDQMSAPKPEESTDGRANAKGIRCLYLGSDTDTTLHEIRASIFDYVCVGKFRLLQDITVVDLTAITKISPFIEELDCLDHAINQQYLERLDFEMSKPLRKNDSTLEYVATQYIVDFIKSIQHNGLNEYDGIVYRSTTNPEGYNLAIFNPDIFECISTEVYEITSVDYKSKRVES